MDLSKKPSSPGAGGRDDVLEEPRIEQIEDAPDAGRETVSIDAPVDQVWKHLVSQPGTASLLESGVLLGGEHDPWSAAEGPQDVIPGHASAWDLRLSWRPDEDGPAALVDLSLRPDGDGTRLELVHQGAGDTRLWRDALDRLRSSFDVAVRDRALVDASPEADSGLLDGLEARRRKLLASLDAMGPLDKHAI